MNIQFRQIKKGEAAAVSHVEQTCFPPNEACKPEIMERRVELFPETILVAELTDDGQFADFVSGSESGQEINSPENSDPARIIGFIIGLATDETTLRDEFFTDPSLHKADGDNIMILSVAVLPDYQRQGIATAMMKEYLEMESARGRKLSVLTCLEEKVSMYAGWGYEDLGASQSNWGGESWHEMVAKLSR